MSKKLVIHFMAIIQKNIKEMLHSIKENKHFKNEKLDRSF